MHKGANKRKVLIAIEVLSHRLGRPPASHEVRSYLEMPQSRVSSAMRALAYEGYLEEVARGYYVLRRTVDEQQVTWEMRLLSSAKHAPPPPPSLFPPPPPAPSPLRVEAPVSPTSAAPAARPSPLPPARVSEPSPRGRAEHRPEHRPERLAEHRAVQRPITRPVIRTKSRSMPSLPRPPLDRRPFPEPEPRPEPRSEPGPFVEPEPSPSEAASEVSGFILHALSSAFSSPEEEPEERGDTRSVGGVEAPHMLEEIQSRRGGGPVDLRSVLPSAPVAELPDEAPELFHARRRQQELSYREAKRAIHTLLTSGYFREAEHMLDKLDGAYQSLYPEKAFAQLVDQVAEIHQHYEEKRARETPEDPSDEPSAPEEAT